MRHRQFVNFFQCQQFIVAFLDKWNVEGKPTGLQVKCALKKCDHSKSSGVQVREHSVYSKMKDNIKCGFAINFSLMEYVSSEKKKYIYYRVRLTTFNFDHNHELSNILKQKVSDSSRKMSSIDTKVINSVLAVLKYNPKYESTELRNMIRKVVPNSTELNAQYLNNLRRRAAIYHATNPDAT